jgi:N utilization substance protein B
MKKKNKGSRSWSRILAVQALYQLYLNRDANKNIVIKSLLQNKESKNKADKNFFLKLVKETLEKQKILEDKIILASNKRKFNKMETLLKVILELGTCELFYFKNIPTNVSLSQYVKVGSSFLNDKEVGLINGILDKVSKNINNNG